MPKYHFNVVGSRCWIRLVNDEDNTKQCWPGTITKFQFEATSKKNDCIWYHTVHFDDGDIEDFDLDFEEFSLNLFWKYPGSHHGMNMEDVEIGNSTLVDQKVPPVPKKLNNIWKKPSHCYHQDTSAETKQKTNKKRAKKTPTATKEPPKKKKKKVQVGVPFGNEIVGQRVMVHFRDSGWLQGTIDEYYSSKGRKAYHRVTYMDGDSVWHNAFTDATQGLRFFTDGS